MATNDLMTELQKDSIKLDDDSERKVVRMLLKLLEDKNGEVQNLAVRCLGPLVGKVKDFQVRTIFYHPSPVQTTKHIQVESIVDHLCNNMVGDKEQLRDISSIGLKTVINELPLTTQSLAASVCKTMTGRLSAAIAQQEDVSVQLEALDILGDLLSRSDITKLSFQQCSVQVRRSPGSIPSQPCGGSFASTSKPKARREEARNHLPRPPCHVLRSDPVHQADQHAVGGAGQVGEHVEHQDIHSSSGSSVPPGRA